MRKIPTLGEQEMEILKFISEHEAVSVREAAAHFDKAKGLARTTVLTMMERLRKKGMLGRVKAEGVFKYSVKVKQETVVQDKVSQFVEKTLGGSVGPLFSYLFSSNNLSDDELKQLRTLAEKMSIHEKNGGGADDVES